MAINLRSGDGDGGGSLISKFSDFSSHVFTFLGSGEKHLADKSKSKFAMGISFSDLQRSILTEIVCILLNRDKNS